MRAVLKKFPDENKLNIRSNIKDVDRMFPNIDHTSFMCSKKSSYLKPGEIDNLIEAFGVIEERDRQDIEYQDDNIKEFYINLYSCNALITDIINAYDNIICIDENIKYDYSINLKYSIEKDTVLKYYNFLLSSKSVYLENEKIKAFIETHRDNYVYELSTFKNDEQRNKFYTNNLKEPAIYNTMTILRFIVDCTITPYIIKQSFMYTWTGENKKLYIKECMDEMRKKSQETELQINMDNVREFFTLAIPNNILTPIVLNLISLKIKTKNVPPYIYMGYKTVKNKINEDEVINIFYNLYITILIKIYDTCKTSEYIDNFKDLYNISTNMIVYEKIRKHVIVRLRSLQAQNKKSIELLTTNGFNLHLKTEQLVKVVLARLTFKGKFTKDIIGFISQIIQREYTYFFNREFKIKNLPYQMPDDVGDDNPNTVPHIDKAVYDALIKLDSTKRLLFLNDIKGIKHIVCRKLNVDYERTMDLTNMIINNNPEFIPSRLLVSFSSGIYAFLTGNNTLSTFLSLKDILFMGIVLSSSCMHTIYLKNFILTSIDPNGKKPSNIDNIVNKAISLLRASYEENELMNNSIDPMLNDFKQTLTKPLLLYNKTILTGTYKYERVGDYVTNKAAIITMVTEYDELVTSLLTLLSRDLLTLCK